MLIRDRILELLADGDLTASAIADELGALRNSVDKALVRARDEREIHVCGYSARTAAFYRLGPGVDAERPAPQDPVSPSEERHDASNVRDAKVSDVQMPVYFELDGGLLPGVRHFACDRLRATMSVSSCGSRWEKANSTDVDADRFHTCRRCSIGASHAGRVDHNPSQFRGMTICARCHRGTTRLIGKHLCVSCFNRARELRIGKNGKGTAPRKLARLDQRSITYRAGGVVKTRTIAETVDTVELMVAVLRDEEHAPQFGWRVPDWLLSDEFDRSIPDDVEAMLADVPDVADSAQDAQEPAAAPLAASVPAEVVEPVVDPLQALRDAVDQLEHDTPVCSPSISKRAAKRQRQQQRRQVRVSNVTVSLLRNVGALPPAPQVVVPLPEAQPFYSAAIMSGGAAFG